MIVKEYVDQNFERNQDPKKAMGIGLKQEIEKMRDELSERYDYCKDKEDNPFYAGQMESLDVAIQLIDNLTIMK